MVLVPWQEFCVCTQTMTVQPTMRSIPGSSFLLCCTPEVVETSMNQAAVFSTSLFWQTYFFIFLLYLLLQTCIEMHTYQESSRLKSTPSAEGLHQNYRSFLTQNHVSLSKHRLHSPDTSRVTHFSVPVESNKLPSINTDTLQT